MSGLYLEQLNPGLVIRHATTRTVTEMDNVMFSALTIESPADAYR